MYFLPFVDTAKRNIVVKHFSPWYNQNLLLHDDILLVCIGSAFLLLLGGMFWHRPFIYSTFRCSRTIDIRVVEFGYVWN